MRLYLLPGVGCDARLFSRLDLTGHEVHHLEWPDFRGTPTLESIARRLSEQVDVHVPHALVGVSMGGMVALELALLSRPRMVVLVSSWTGPWEWPPFVRVSAWLGLYVLISDATLRAAWPLKRLIDRRAKDVDALLFDMATRQGGRQLRLGTRAILRWKGSRWNGPLVRIHGDKDIVTPLRFPVDHVVHGGQHVMVLTRAAEVSRLIREALLSA